jgi:hypothetical protein
MQQIELMAFSFLTSIEIRTVITAGIASLHTYAKSLAREIGFENPASGFALTYVANVVGIKLSRIVNFDRVVGGVESKTERLRKSLN